MPAGPANANGACPQGGPALLENNPPQGGSQYLAEKNIFMVEGRQVLKNYSKEQTCRLLRLTREGGSQYLADRRIGPVLDGLA